MGAGAFLEPLAVVVLLFGGAWVNREPNLVRSHLRKNSAPCSPRRTDEEDGFPITSPKLGTSSKSPKATPNRAHSPSLIVANEERWRKRRIGFLGWHAEVGTPNTAAFRNRMLSRLIHKFPFLVECWYWALIYWVGVLVPEELARYILGTNIWLRRPISWGELSLL